MGGFGDKLRREREMRGVTLGEISESTKVSKRWLQALEDEQFDVLPGGVFNRGFVRAYARFLGIDEDQAVADYVAASDEQPQPEDKFPLEIHEKSGSPPLNPKRSFLPVVLAIIALVLVVGGWTWWVKHKPQSSAHVSEIAEQRVTPQTTPAAPSVGSSQPSSATNPSEPISAQEMQMSETVAGQPSSAAEQNENSSRTRKSGGGSQAPAAEPEKKAKLSNDANQNLAKSFIVFIKAKEDSWVSIVADGKPQWEGMLDANMERSIHAARELVLKTGNAGGLDISYNGKPLGALGKERQVRTLTFNTAGLQQ